MKRQQATALLELGWTYRRIEAETGIRRETVSRVDRLRRAKAARVFAGSGLPPRPAAAAYHDAILEKLAARLSYQHIWQEHVAGAAALGDLLAQADAAPGSAVGGERVAHVEAEDLRKSRTRAMGEGEDWVVSRARGRNRKQGLLFGAGERWM